MSRVVDADLADKWATKVEALVGDVEAVLKEEREEKALGHAEMQVRKGENVLTYEEEIRARPKRTWFESEREKRESKESGRVELNGGVGLGGMKAGGKLSGKDKKRLDDGRERKEGRVWKKGKGGERGVGFGRKGKGGKKGGGKDKKVKGGRR